MNTLVNVTIGEITKMKVMKTMCGGVIGMTNIFLSAGVDNTGLRKSTWLWLAQQKCCHWGALLTLTKPTGTKERPPSSNLCSLGSRLRQ